MARMRRRAFLQKAALGMGVLATARPSRAFAQATQPITIPFLLTLSGPAAVIGERVKLGAEITADLINRSGGILGRNVQLKFVDDTGKTDGAVSAIRELISDGNRFVGGCFLSQSLQAMLPVIRDAKVVLLGCGGISLSFTHEDFTRYFFPGVENDYQRARAMAHLAAEKFPNVLNWGATLSDTQSYSESYANFSKFAGEEYGKSGKHATFADSHRFKFGTTDFRSQISQLAASPVDGLYSIVLGADGIAMWQQAAAFDLRKKIKVVMDQTIDFSIAKVLKNQLPNHLWTVVTWYSGLYKDQPFSRSFYDEYVKRTNDPIPSGYVQYGNQTVNIMAQVLRATDGSTDPDRMIKVLETDSFTTAKGKYRYRPRDHLLEADINIVELNPSDSSPGFVISDAIKFPSIEFALPPDPGRPAKL